MRSITQFCAPLAALLSLFHRVIVSLFFQSSLFPCDFCDLYSIKTRQNLIYEFNESYSLLIFNDLFLFIILRFEPDHFLH